MFKIKIAGIAALAVLAIASSACAPGVATADPAGPTPDAGQTETTQPLDPGTPSDDPTTSDDPTSSDSSDSDQTFHFGDTVTYADGLAVTVGKPVGFKPSEYAAKGEHDKNFVKMSVTIKNGSAKRYDPSEFYHSATTGEREAEAVYDTEKGVNGAPDTTLLKGKTTSFVIAYGVDKGKDFVLEIGPNWDHDSAIFVS